ncbi:MAG: GxxExxY protein [Pontiellaceae bacterium]|jgi:GxxExxY protein|nr:GxxExxY protein [Pontiellaceae bacterium]
MPITINHPIKMLSEQDFHALDYQVMKLAFETHNELGRFYNEEIYKHELIERCQKSGLETAKEVKINLTHGSFKKNLFIDLLIECGSICELKAVRSIDASHRVQTLGYLFLSGTQHGKIINFRPPSVEHEFVSTSLTQVDRRLVSINEKNWNHESKSASRLKSIVINLLTDWGAFLDTDLYKEAICQLYGNGEEIIQPVEIKTGTSVLGKQNIPLLSPTESFCVSSIKTGISAYKTHLHRFLQHTHLKCLHWINIDNLNIQFQSLSNPNYSDPNYSD